MVFHQHSIDTAWSVGASYGVGSAQVQTCLLSYYTTDPAGNISPFRIKRGWESWEISLSTFCWTQGIQMSEPELHKVLYSRVTFQVNTEQTRGSIQNCHCSILEQSSDTERGALKTGSSCLSTAGGLQGYTFNPRTDAASSEGTAQPRLAFPCIWLFHSHGVHERFP